jgi:Amt family ammonium transporter
MAMIIVTILWVVIGLVYHLASIGGIGNPLPNLFFHVGPNTAWSLAPTIPFLLFALFKLNSQ